MALDFEPFRLSLFLSLTTTGILYIAMFPLAYLLAYKKFPLKAVLDAMLTLPLVLPPTVLGFYLLVLLAPDAPLGKFLLSLFGVRLVFSFPGMVFASCIYSLPFMVQQLKNGLLAVPRSLHEASSTLGKRPIETFFRVLLPNMKPAVVTAGALTFAHTMGEFGVVLMIGGSIPGSTKVASIALFDLVETMNFGAAHIYAAILAAFSLLVLTAVNLLNGKRGGPSE